MMRKTPSRRKEGIFIVARKPKKKDTVSDFDSEEFIRVPSEDNVTNNMMTYSGAAIVRMIPDVRDGLIPVHRRIVHTMKTDAKLSSTSKHMKVAKVTGLTMGYHPHGDASISSSLTVLSQPWVNYLPLTDVEGNNGSTARTGDYSAPRYIECRLSPYAELNMEGMNRNAVDMIPNYDNTTTEPSVLPAQIPMLYTNGTAGSQKIAVGFSTNIPPHNPVELLTAAELVNRRKRITLKEIMEIVPAPDLPTGNIILDTEGLEQMYETGSGKFTIRANVEFEGKDIVITEVPYGVTRTVLIKSITQALINNKLESQVKDIVDETVEDNIRIVISCESKSSPETIVNFLYKKSQLQFSFNSHILAIVDGKPTMVGLLDYLKLFVDFRRETIRRIYTFDKETLDNRLHLVEGFIDMIDISDQVIATIKKTKGKADAAQTISKKFGFSDRQANAIVSMQLYRISNQDLMTLKKEREDLNKEISRLSTILTDDKEFTKEISKVLKKTIKDLGDMPRRTDIVNTSSEVSVDQTALVTKQDVVVVATPDGIQRMSKQVFDNNIDSTATPIVAAFDANTTQGVTLLTKRGLAMQRVVDEVENLSVRTSPEDLRRHVSTFNADDDIIACYPFELDKETGLSVVSVTAQGQVKHCPLDSTFFAFTQKGYLTRAKPYNGLKLSGDRIIYASVVPTENIKDISFSLKRSTGGRVTKVNLGELKPQGGSGSGVNMVKITKEGDEVIITTTNCDKFDILNGKDLNVR